MQLHSQILGEGFPFLILHGFLGMSDNWKTLGRKFSEAGFQVHLIDQRNHGHSFHDPNFSYEIMAEDLNAYMQLHGIEKAHLLGHSMGGKTVMQFAVEHPEKVEKLMVADIAPKAYPPHHQDILKALSSLDFEIITSRGEADEALAAYIPQKGIRQFLLKNLYWKEKGKLGLRMNLPVLISKYDEIGKALPKDATFEGDTLFLKGAQSGYILPEDGLLLSQHFPNYQLSTISNAGHWLHAENPDEFYDKIMDFLK